MRLRTIRKAFEEIKAADPGTSLTLYGFQRKVYSGQWPSVNVGKRHLVDMDKIIEILKEGEEK